LVEQINELLSDQSWWSADRRTEAENRFESVVVAIFFDGMEAGKTNSAALREAKIPLPSKDAGYSRVMLSGTTGAGKTTLLRHLIGSSHAHDRFPSTSTARTTTADIEIITSEDPFEAVVTFMPEHEVRAHVDECLEEACLNAIQQQADAKIAAALLSHREQRFRLFYPLGSWQEEHIEPKDDFSFDDEEPEVDELDEQETVSASETARNRARLAEFVSRVTDLSKKTGDITAESVGNLEDMDHPEDRAGWLEIFGETLYEQEEFAKLALNIMDDVEDRFNLIQTGTFERGPTGWPVTWSLKESSRETFLKQVRWFSSNHYKQFGRLLTPLVDGMRVRGPFQPLNEDMRVAPKLVLIDGEGIGHSAKSVSSISTRVTRRFSEVDMILIVDNAEQPMQTAPLELLRSIGNSGHADKLAVAFTHFDLVKGQNFGSFQQKRDHVMNSVRDAIGSLKQSIGAPVAAMLEKQIEDHAFFLGGLDREIEKLPHGFRDQMRELLIVMQAAAEPAAPTEAAPIYSVEGLEIALRDAVEGFQKPWKGRLGLRYHDGIPKEHWTRVKALTRRFANAWKNEYDTLRPVADLVARLQENISRWLDSPAQWTRVPRDDEERNAALATIRKSVFAALHDLAETRLAEAHRSDWRSAFDFAGRGSSYRRAEEIDRIYEEAAPLISSAMSEPARSFLHSLHQLVRTAVEEAGGQFQQSNAKQST
jgi:GTPase Era involved in 16S rRNA processing